MLTLPQNLVSGIKFLELYTNQKTFQKVGACITIIQKDIFFNMFILFIDGFLGKLSLQNMMIKDWLFLFSAAFFEALWTFSLKFLNFKAIGLSFKKHELLSKEFGNEILPLIGYIIFGAINIYLLSLALKNIPTTTAIAVWMASSLIFTKIVDIFYFKSNLNISEVFFIGLIVVGIVGLKKVAT